MSSESLRGKTAVVTGASSGIGRAIAEKFGRVGAHVYLAGRTAEPMEESKRRIESDGGKATIVVTDLRHPDRVRSLVDAAVAGTGRLDIMVNNAGLAFLGSVVNGEPEQWREMLEINILALLTCCQAAVRAMRECGAEGHIVNISSNAARRPDSGVYGATKHAVNVISNTLRTELENDSIRVVTIMPGAIATNFSRNFDPALTARLLKEAGVELEVKLGERLPDEVIDKMQLAMRKLFGSVDDVAAAVFYAVTQPIDVNVFEIVVRPPKMLGL
jgi:NADP-dependent 3-hydroxy acid dehydrogenase YdfG